MSTLQQRLSEDETDYILQKLFECKEGGHLYYVHSKNISRAVELHLIDANVYVYRGFGYTYVCLAEERDRAFEQMRPRYNENGTISK